MSSNRIKTVFSGMPEKLLNHPTMMVSAILASVFIVKIMLEI